MSCSGLIRPCVDKLDRASSRPHVSHCNACADLALRPPCSYESLPPNFSLLQNMVAGAFAGIAVRTEASPVPSR